MQGPVRVVLLDSSQTHQSCFSPLEGLGECLPDRGYSPGALDICECPWWSAPLWEPRSSKTQSSRKPGWEAKILQLGRGFSSKTSHFYPLITRPICSGCGRKIAPLCFRYILYLLQHVQYPHRLYPILLGWWLPLDTLESSSAVTLSQ